MESPLLRRCFAEFLGTMILVFIGTGAVAVNASHPDNIGHVGIALSFGLVVMLVIYAIGGVSGAHINPAVTIAFTVAGRFPGREVPWYCLAQFAGAIAGSFLVLSLFGDGGRLGATTYSCPTAAAIGIEFVLSAILMFVVMGVSTGAKEETITAGIAVGATIAVEAMVGGPVTGASMNPARSFGPALVGQDLAQVWIYLVVPVVGTISGVALYRAIKVRQPEG